ncbi:MAG TPA: ABATE domain-containing protein [Longimicrobiales bacterium]
MAEIQRTMQNLDLVGGNVALDFANSGDGPVAGGTPTERLHTYGDLLTFAQRSELIGAGRAAELRAEAERRPAAAADVVERARVLRDTLYAAFSAVAHAGRARQEDIEVLNSFLEEGMRYRRLERDERCCGWTWSAGEEPLAQMLWPIVNAAAELLVEGELERVKTCGNEACSWLFLDMSRNRSRRWCDMKDCGNRAKARRHYARQRGSAAD